MSSQVVLPTQSSMEEQRLPAVESVLLKLHTQMELTTIITNSHFRNAVPRSILMSRIKQMHEMVVQSTNKKGVTLVASFGKEQPSTSSAQLEAPHNGETSICRMKLTPESCRRVSFILEKIQRLLLTRTTVTRRDIYYQNVCLFKTQQAVDRAIGKICQLLNTPQWNLGVISTSKGLVYGPVRILLHNGETVDCSLQPGGTLIPQDLPHGASYESSAKFGLILEKDTAFQNILSSGLKYPLDSCILITGKGYPDMITRFLVKDLSSKLSIPIFALVDCDPHGIDIFFNYKYGSMAKSFINEQLAASYILWLGIHPTDMFELQPTILQRLTAADTRKIKSLLERSYVKDNEKLQVELKSLAQQERKCEIENITTISNRYLNDVYIPAKISLKKLI